MLWGGTVSVLLQGGGEGGRALALRLPLSPCPSACDRGAGLTELGVPFPFLLHDGLTVWGRALKHDYLDMFPARILSLALSGLGREMAGVFKMGAQAKSVQSFEAMYQA